MASSARHHLFVLAFVAALAVVAPRASAWGGGRFFFSKTARPRAAAVDVATAAPDAAGDPNRATEFSRPSTGGGGRGYGLYGRPEENLPPDYFHRGVHRNAEKLTTTNVPDTSAAAEAVPELPGGGRGERVEPSTEDNGSGRGRPPRVGTNDVAATTSTEPFVEDNGSGRGRPPWTTNTYYVPTTTSAEETELPVGRGTEPFVEDNGSGMGRRPRRYGPGADGTRRPAEEQRNYGMSDTRLYQNGRYYYDVNTGRYGYGRESNPVRTRPDEFRDAAGDRRGRYYGAGKAAGYYQYGDSNELGSGVMENPDGFQVEGRNGRYIP